jgi:hypothetical protein
MQASEVLGYGIWWDPAGRFLLAPPWASSPQRSGFPPFHPLSSLLPRSQQGPSLAWVLGCPLPVLTGGKMGLWTAGQADGSAGLGPWPSSRSNDMLPAGSL